MFTIHGYASEVIILELCRGKDAGVVIISEDSLSDGAHSFLQNIQLFSWRGPAFSFLNRVLN